MRGFLIAVLIWGMALPTYADGIKYVGPVKVVGPVRMVAPPPCGAGILGADIYDQTGCGNVGNAYLTEGGSQTAYQTGATSISACTGTALSVSTKYYLTQSISAADGATVCLDIRQGTQLDLNGFTITGRVRDTVAFDQNGTSIFNGTINCAYSVADASGGCINFVSDGHNVTATGRIHHLTISNSGSSSTLPTVAIYRELTTATNANDLIGDAFYNLNITMSLTSTASRNDAIRLVGSNSGNTNFWVFNNRIQCSGNTNACQGIENSNSKGDKYFNNYLIADTIATATETARLAVCDANAAFAVDAGCDMFNNKFEPNDNRAARYRSRIGRFHDNLIVNAKAIAGSGGSHGTIHMCDQTEATAESYIGLLLYNNNFKNTVSGNMFYCIAGTGGRASNNTAEGTTGTAILGLFNSTQAGGPTTFQFCSNATFNTPNITANQTGAGVTTIGATSSGTGTGTGTVNAGTCPTAGNP